MKGKYGYYDPEGVLREASYGAGSERGFEPVIEGVELPPPTIEQDYQDEIPQTFEPEIQNPQRFKNFQPAIQAPKKLSGKVKIVNGRRAVLKKRLRAKPTPATAKFIDTNVQRENNLRAREEQLKTLREHRQNLILLQQRQSGSRQDSPRSFNGFQQKPQQEVFRSAAPAVRDPYVTGLDLNSGSYSYSYRK